MLARVLDVKAIGFEFFCDWPLELGVRCARSDLPCEMGAEAHTEAKAAWLESSRVDSEQRNPELNIRRKFEVLLEKNAFENALNY